MKFTVYLALMGVAACQEIPEMDEDWEDLEEDDLEEDLNITSPDRDRRLESLHEGQYRAWEQLRDGIGRKFGPKFEQLRKRYEPSAKKFGRSKEVQARQQWERDVAKNYKSGKRFMDNVKNFKQDVFGGYNREERRWHRSLFEGAVDGDRIEGKDGQRINKVHVDNDAIKDIIEDATDVLRDFDGMYRDKKLLIDVHNSDKAILKNADFQRMLKMAQDDLNIHSWRDFGRKAKKFGRKMEQMEKERPKCPLMRRMKKMNERVFRHLVANYKITDLPKDARQRFVNRLLRMVVMKVQQHPRTDPIKEWTRIVKRLDMMAATGVGRWWKSLHLERIPELQKWD